MASTHTLCSLTEHGQNAEKGSHDALMVSSGRYADLYNTYFRHKSPVYISSRRKAGGWY